MARLDGLQRQAPSLTERGWWVENATADTLTDATVAVFLAPRGTEEIEFAEPRRPVEYAEAGVDVVGVETGEVRTVNDDLESVRRSRSRKPFPGSPPTTTTR